MQFDQRNVEKAFNDSAKNLIESEMHRKVLEKEITELAEKNAYFCGLKAFVDSYAEFLDEKVKSLRKEN